MTASTETKKSPFENTTCGRCGGTGRYSFNQIHGSTCYGCGGKGWKLTKRGAAAHAFYRGLITRTYADVKPGDQVWQTITAPNGLSSLNGWMRVASVEQTTGTRIVDDKEVNYPTITLTMARKIGGYDVRDCGLSTSSIMIRPNAEAYAKAIAQARAYEGRLGKNGKELSAKALARLEADRKAELEWIDATIQANAQ